MEKHILKIEKLDHSGRGIAHCCDKIVFVPYALIDEVVEVEIVKEKKSWMEGRMIRILESSERRIKPTCPYYDVCGGCDVMHMSYQDQIAWKEEKVKEIMQKFAGLSPSVISHLIPCEQEKNYRNKLVLQVQDDIGFFEKRSHHLVKIEECQISDARINEVLRTIRSRIPLTNVYQIMIRASKNTDDIMVVFDVSKQFTIEDVVSILKDKVSSIIVKQNHKYKTVFGKDDIVEKLNGVSFQIAPDAFFQVNTKQTEKLYQAVKDTFVLSRDDVVLDLYCGTGTIGIFLAPFVKQVIGVEVNAQAIESAKKNQELNKVSNIEWKLGKVEDVIPGLQVDPNVVIVDPPRSGLDVKTIERIKDWNVEKVVYVSCDPVTLARDLKMLQEKYVVVKIVPVDMFPQTKHVECVASLHLKNKV